MSHLKEQIQLTRTQLIGNGIICGLEFYTDNYCHVNLTKGCGVTSHGHVLLHPDAKFRYYKEYLNPFTCEADYPKLSKRLQGAVDYFFPRAASRPRLTGKHFIYQLFESPGEGRIPLTPQGVDTEADIGDWGFSGFDEDKKVDTGANLSLDSRVLLLYLEEEEPESVVPLVLHEEDVFAFLVQSGELKDHGIVIEQEDEPIGFGDLFRQRGMHSEGELYNAFHKNLLLDDIAMRRFGYGSFDKLALEDRIYPDLPESDIPYLRVFKEYNRIIDLALVELRDRLDKLHKYFQDYFEPYFIKYVNAAFKLFFRRRADYLERSAASLRKIREVVLGPDNQYLILFEEKNSYLASDNLPDNLKNDLSALKSSGEVIRHVALGPDDRYVILAEKRSGNRFSTDIEQLSPEDDSPGQGAPDPRDLKTKLNKLLDEGRKVRQIALGPAGQYVIVTENPLKKVDITDETSKPWFLDPGNEDEMLGEVFSLGTGVTEFDFHLQQFAFYYDTEGEDLGIVVLTPDQYENDYCSEGRLPLGFKEKMNSSALLTDEGKRKKIRQVALSPEQQFIIFTEEATGFWYSVNVPRELKEHLKAATGGGQIGIQYFYAFTKDLVETYNALRLELNEITAATCGNERHHPRHVMLGKLQEEVTFQRSIFRHYPQQPPVYNGNQDRIDRIRFLHWRFVIMFKSFSIPDPNFDTNIAYDDPSDEAVSDVLRRGEDTFPDTHEEMELKVTPSLPPSAPLGKQAIPCYYPLSRSYFSLQHYWDFETTKNNREDHHFSYHADHSADSYTTLERVIQPFAFSIEDYDFFRIEGHLGKKLNPTVDDQGHFKQGILRELLSLRNRLNLPFDVISMSLSELISLYDKLLFEKEPFETHEWELEQRLAPLQLRLLKKRGLEYLGGVKKGGTFVLVYDDQSGGEHRIVADYCLPFYCCRPDAPQFDEQPALVELQVNVFDCLGADKKHPENNLLLKDFTLIIGNKKLVNTGREEGPSTFYFFPGIYPVQVEKEGYRLQGPTTIEVFGNRPGNQQTQNLYLENEYALVLLDFFMETGSPIPVASEDLVVTLKSDNKNLIDDAFRKEIQEHVESQLNTGEEVAYQASHPLKLPKGSHIIQIRSKTQDIRSVDQLSIEADPCTLRRYDLWIEDSMVVVTKKELIGGLPDEGPVNVTNTYFQGAYPFDRINRIFEAIGEVEDTADASSLQFINGIDGELERRLHSFDIGIYTFEQISKLDRLSVGDLQFLEAELQLMPGTIMRQDWVGQAKGRL